MQRNTITFDELIKGEYGRKIAYYDADRIDETNIIDALAKTVGIFNSNKEAIKYLHRYYKGDQPILYRKKIMHEEVNNKIVENRAYEIVQFSVAQSYGEPLQYVSTSKDERINKAVDELNKIVKNAFKFQRNVEQGEWKSSVGTSFLAVARTGDTDDYIRLTVPTPLNTYIIYSSYTGIALASVQELYEVVDGKRERYFLIFTPSLEIKVKNSSIVPVLDTNGVLVNSKPHAYGGIPIVEVPNNSDRLSDIELVIKLLDAINLMASNRLDGVEQFIQSWIKFVNCQVDEDSFLAMKQQGALVVKSNNGDNKADVEVMTQELNQTESQVAKDDYWDSALSILAIPSKQGNTGGDTQGAVELRNGWDFAKNRAKLKDAYIIEAEKKLAKVILNLLRVDGNDLGITIKDFDVNIPHSPQDNMSVKANVLTLLLQAGIHPLIAIKVSGLWNDPENVYLMSKPYLDVIYKTIDDAIAEIPDADEQTQKAQQIVAQNTNNPTSKLEERLRNAFAEVR